MQYLEHEILHNKYSPDAVCGRQKLLKKFPTILSTKTIYNYIDLGLLRVKNLDLLLKVKLKSKKRRCRRNKKILGTSIEERPQIINKRLEFGHWEIDTVVGLRKAGEVLLTLDERRTRKRYITKIASKTSQAVKAGLDRIVKCFGSKSSSVFKSITADNGSEFSSLAADLKGKVNVYFAHPYSPGERGTNEKQNSLVRSIPKGKDIAKVSDYAIKKVESWINELPRKMFNYHFPQELFDKQLSALNISI